MMARALPDLPLRPISDDEVETFWRDGVVCLREVMPAEWLDFMAGPVEASLTSSATTDLTAFGEDLAANAGAALLADRTVEEANVPRGHFKAGTDHWRIQPEFLTFAVESPLGAIVAALLRSEHVWLYEDSVLVKEPGTRERTAFHQDMAYFNLDGDLVCTTWVPLDPVTANSGAVRFVVGSHRDQTRFKPNTFVTDLALPGDDGVDVPDYDHQSMKGAARIVSFDTEPGDMTVHHARTIHGANGNSSATRRRRAISVRYAGDGTVFAPAAAQFAKAHQASMSAGDPLDPKACPQAWPRP
ncbi:MAG TPA: phytanoyl-CoA dioxygenase family protein [Ilumatobacteraceae bacterium]|nr:phytanoyl-CoA dioxygenase family protein [Ilumatobacteraceae bacterium]